MTPETKRVLRALRNLADVDVSNSAEFVFILELKKTLIEHGFEPGEAKDIAASQNIPMPFGATHAECQEMAQLYGDLYIKAYNALISKGKYNDPVVEAGHLARQLLSPAIEQAAQD